MKLLYDDCNEKMNNLFPYPWDIFNFNEERIENYGG